MVQKNPNEIFGQPNKSTILQLKKKNFFFFFKKLGKHPQHLPSLPHSFQFPRPVVPTSLIFLAFSFLNSHVFCSDSDCHIFLMELLMTTMTQRLVTFCATVWFFFWKFQIWSCHLTSKNIYTYFLIKKESPKLLRINFKKQNMESRHLTHFSFNFFIEG